MTKARKQSLMKTIAMIKADLAVKNYTKALSACGVLTCAGFGVPAFTPAYWHAKYLQHKLYYYGTWNHDLSKVNKEVSWIANQIRRTETEA